MTAPHLLQNFVPSESGAPQELQKAMAHLVASSNGGVYRSGFKVSSVEFPKLSRSRSRATDSPFRLRSGQPRRLSLRDSVAYEVIVQGRLM